MAQNENQIPVLVMPRVLRSELIELAHAQRHFGQEKTLNRLKSVAWWPQMSADVEHFISNCLRCAQTNPKPRSNKGPLKHQPIDGPWKRLQIDFFGPLPKTAKGNAYCLVIVDPFSKWIEAIPIRTCTAKATTRVLLNEVFSCFGLPMVIDSDQGSHFTAEITKQLCTALNITQRFHIAGHPQSSGQVERSNRTIKTALRKMVDASGMKWDQHLPLILMAMRSTISSVGYTPHEVLFGRPMRTSELWWLQGGVPSDEFQPRVKIDQYIQHLLSIISEVQQNVACELKRNIVKMDKRLAEE